MNEKNRYDVGVIVARFQVSSLHEAHKELIQHVVNQHPKVIIVLGFSPLKTTEVNPLDLEMRRHVISDDFPEIPVFYVKDCQDDALWSKRLDEVIVDCLSPNQSAVLYGGRSSFIETYSGKFPTIELEPTRYISGSEIRQSISKKVMRDPKFRAGVIWSTSNQFPVAYPCVDIAIVDPLHCRLLLARKSDEQLHRFVGGFATPNSISFEDDAAREVKEETHLTIDAKDLRYLGSFKIDDWRYRREKSKIKSLFFISTQLVGEPTPDDDIAELAWFPLEEVKKKEFEQKIVREHHPLLARLQQELNKY